MRTTFFQFFAALWTAKAFYPSIRHDSIVTSSLRLKPTSRISLFAANDGSIAVRSMKPSDDGTSLLQMLSFYRFHQIDEPSSVRDSLFEALSKIEGIRGTIYLAKEGINAQLAVPVEKEDDDGHNDLSSLDRLIDACSTILPFDPFETNPPNMGEIVDSQTPTFNRFIVRTRNAILRDGLNDDTQHFDWSDDVYELTPEEWDKEIRKRQSGSGLFLDCRNRYESEQGTFEGAEALDTDVFSESWDILEKKVDDVDCNEPIYIFCTGGIRCVKVSSYLKQKFGFTNVRSLQHGIIGYQKWAKTQNMTDDSPSIWNGSNFLFDRRRLKSINKSD